MNQDPKQEKWQILAKDNNIQSTISEKVLGILGFRVRPFLFWNPLSCFILQFLVVGGLIATLYFIFSLRNESLKINEMLIFVLSGAFTAGLISVARQYKLRKSLNLKNWDEF